ncbi:MAG TPA: hypothetical protein VHX15_01075 [Frankiaceae bacterium]|nr:hypothetical protein [Frankiaceae bacterium]
MALPEPDGYSVPRHDVIALVSGLLVFVASFLPWYALTFEGGPAESGVTGSFNAWHGLAGIGLILMLFSLVVTAAEPYFGEDGSTPLPVSIVAAVLACVGALLVVIRSLDLPTPDVPGVSAGLRWGGWILILLVVLQALISVLRVVHVGDPER